MAKKWTIGANIELSGEKEFRKALSDIASSTRVTNSEMKLLSATYVGNQNSMQALQAKGRVLSQALQEQRDRVNVLTQALNHATETYGENDTRTDRWRTQLNNARASLARLSREVEENNRYLEEARNSSDGCATSIDEYGRAVRNAEADTQDLGSTLSDVFAGNVLADKTQELASAITDQIGKVKDFVLESSEATNRLTAATGASAEVAKQYGEQIDQIYSNNFGDSISDVADKFALVKQNINESDPTKLSGITENLITLEDTFGSDFSETVRGVNSLMENFGLSSEQAFDYIS